MAGQRAAGYCSHCNRGVTIERPKQSGLIEKMRSALNKTADDSDWVCSKCGEPATRGFSPPPDAVKSEEPAAIQAEEVHPGTNENLPKTDPPPSAIDTEESPTNTIFTVASTAPEPGKLEATCHLCDAQIPFDKESANQQIVCPSCSAPVVLPAGKNDSSLLTAPPKITKLDDDPERPEISKAVCTGCNFELTYPKRLAGKNVDCPSCSEKFILP